MSQAGLAAAAAARHFATMCFSATASFVATGVTSVAGVGALTGARKPAHLLLAAIPLLFAVHQLAEGLLWLALSRPEYAGWARAAMFTFLSVAEVGWPFWVPLAIRALEDERRRRRVLSALLALGVVVAAARVYGLWAYPVSARIVGQHIQYRLDTPWAIRWPSDIAYAIVTVLPPFVSSIRSIRILGLILLVSLVVSKIFFYQFFISVWCFFAALISALVVLVVRRGSRRSAPREVHASASLR